MACWRARWPTRDVVVALWLPLLCFGVLAWNRRWMSDDGYINLRIVWHVMNGHGPVFNIGERVEAGTSPLWIAILVAGRIVLWFLDPAWMAVVVGIALSLTGLALAIVGARHWWTSLDRDAQLPVGAAALLALPPLWDFASSGLETGLSFAWIGACWWATTRRLTRQPPAGPHDPWWTPALIGLGVLVRPDLLLLSVAFAVALAVTSTRSPRHASTVRALAIGLALPVAYQIFRMGYYGLLVPNTALAKEAGRSVWSRGWTYLDTYFDATLLPLALTLLLVVFVVNLRAAPVTTRHIVVAGAPFVAAVLHLLYVVKVGGDFMYARLLLPATFAALCPVAAVPWPARARQVQWVPVGLLAAWVVVVGGFRRWEPPSSVVAFAIGDERVAWTTASGRSHPITLDDYDDTTFLELTDGVRRQTALVELWGGRRAPAPRLVVAVPAIGMVGARLQGTHVIDTYALAEPVGAHLTTGPLVRAGHEKPFPWEWMVGRFGSEPLEDADARLVRQALGCGALAELEEAVEAPLTPSRFVENLTGAIGRTRLRVPRDPRQAREQFCGQDP